MRLAFGCEAPIGASQCLRHLRHSTKYRHRHKFGRLSPQRGQKRLFDCQPRISGLPRTTDIFMSSRHVSDGPQPETTRSTRRTLPVGRSMVSQMDQQFPCMRRQRLNTAYAQTQMPHRPRISQCGDAERHKALPAATGGLRHNRQACAAFNHLADHVEAAQSHPNLQCNPRVRQATYVGHERRPLQ